MRLRPIGFLITLALAILLVPVVSHAQRPAKVPRIGMLLGNDPDAAAPSLEAFRQGLREWAMWRARPSLWSTALQRARPSRSPPLPRSWSSSR
jgi:hypothetical protein